MPYCLSGEPIPEAMIKADKRINLAFLILNSAFPVLEGIGYYLSDTVSFSHPEDNKAIQTFISVTKFCMGLMAINSAVFLAIGLIKIKRGINKKDGTDTIDLGVLVLHMASLVLYIVSQLVYYVFFMIYYVF